MNDFKYRSVDYIDGDQLNRDLESANPETIANALYAASRYAQDTRWVQDQCLDKLTSRELTVRWAAATCLGDLAFFRRPLDVEKVIPALEAATQDQTIADPASFSLSMVKEFSVM